MISVCCFLVAWGFFILRKNNDWWHGHKVTTTGRIHQAQRKLTGWQRLAFKRNEFRELINVNVVYTAKKIAPFLR
jgi:hypothetical protein